MKIFTFILILYSVSGLCQGTKALAIKDGTIDNYFVRLFENVGFNSTATSTKYRIWTDSKVLEIDNSLDSLARGQVIEFAFRIRSRDESIKKMFFVSSVIPVERVNTILAKLNDIISIPGSDSISDWKIFLDGDYYGIEIQKGMTVEKKHYDDLFGQEIEEIRPVQDFFSLLDKLVFDKTMSKLSLPTGDYKFKSGAIIMSVK